MKNISVYFNQLIGVTTNLVIVILLLSCVAIYDGRLFGTSTERFLKKRDVVDNVMLVKYPFLKTDGWEKAQKGIWHKVLPSGDVTETVIFTEKHAKGINGYGGPIFLQLYLDADKRIKNVVVGENYETPFFLENVLKSDFLSQFVGKRIPGFNRRDYDTVTGATVSSSAIIASISKSSDAYRTLVMDKPVLAKSEARDHKLLYKNLMALLTVLFALLMFLFFKGSKLFRTIQLFLNVIVLGFVCGAMLSTQLFLNLVTNGMNLTTGLVPVVIITLILLLNVFGKKNFYCTWVCPFGSAQELFGRLSKINLSFNPKVMKLLNNLRNCILLFLLFISWVLGFGFVFDYEPFTAFLLTQAATPVLVIAGVFLFLSIFVKKCWCRFCCPTGALFNFIQTTNK